MEQKNTLNENQEDIVTVWAVSVPSFTLDMLTGQVQRLRSFSADSSTAAKEQIQKWKKAGKIKFARGYWKWQF